MTHLTVRLIEWSGEDPLLVCTANEPPGSDPGQSHYVRPALASPPYQPGSFSLAGAPGPHSTMSESWESFVASPCVGRSRLLSLLWLMSPPVPILGLSCTKIVVTTFTPAGPVSGVSLPLLLYVHPPPVFILLLPCFDPCTLAISALLALVGHRQPELGLLPEKVNLIGNSFRSLPCPAISSHEVS